MKHLSRLEIERIGERVLNAYRQLPEVAPRQLYRVEPELLIEKLLSLSLDFCHLSVDRSILGVTAYEPIDLRIYGDNGYGEQQYYHLNGKTILVEQDLRDSTLQQGRYNFTLAHEASHHILNMMFPTKNEQAYCSVSHYYREQTRNKKPIKDWEEWQANTLAAAILLPKELVGRALFTFGLPEKIDVTEKIYAPVTYERFSDAAKLLGVSKTAFSIRLKQLGILKQDYYDGLSDVFDIVKDEEVRKVWPK